jgi:hypothetical protein
MMGVKTGAIPVLIAFFILSGGFPVSVCTRVPFQSSAYAEKESFYTSDDEFLPLGDYIEDTENESDSEYLDDETIIKHARVKGIKLVKEEQQLIFVIDSDYPSEIKNKDLKYSIVAENFPPRVIIHLYGVTSEEKIFHFFKNLDIQGIVYNPFVRGYYSEFVIFFKEWMTVEGNYSLEEHRLYVDYTLGSPEVMKGYGVRIADTKIDPLPQVIEIKNQLRKYGLESYLLIASDYETVVLESPFFGEKTQALEYMESLENFGFKGKLAIRQYRDYPQPHRFDVVSEVVITEENGINLKNIVYSEFLPQKIRTIGYSDLYVLTKDIFSPSVQSDVDTISEFYFELAEIYRNYETEDENVQKMAIMSSLKMLEIIVFFYPGSQIADDALWEMANIINEYGISDVLGEEECYRKLLKEYPESIFSDEAKARIETKP